jgi:hypothetical protein
MRSDQQNRYRETLLSRGLVIICPCPRQMTSFYLHPLNPRDVE